MMFKEKRGAEAPFHPKNEVDQVTGAIITEHPGITLRQWYAGLAMQGLLASDRVSALSYIRNPQSLSDDAFDIADAMIKQGGQS